MILSGTNIIFQKRMDKFLIEMAEERKQRQKEIAEERKERQKEIAEEKKRGSLKRKSSGSSGRLG